MSGKRSMHRMAGATSLLCPVAYFLTPARAALATTCYLELGSKLFIGVSDFACGVVNDTSAPLTCCSAGDICLGNSICQVLTGPRGPGYSGYYLGGCNDPSFQDSSCTRHCTSNLLPDVVYNTTTKKWNCCNTTNNVVDCNNPIVEAFDAPAPSDLSSTFSIPASTATSTSASSSSTSTSSNTSSSATPTSSPSSSQTSPATASKSSSLSTGAQAGIGVGASFSGLSISGLLAFLRCRHLRRRREQRQPQNPALELPNNRQSLTYQNPAWQTLSKPQYPHPGGATDAWVTAQTATWFGGVLPKSGLPMQERNDAARVGRGGGKGGGRGGGSVGGGGMMDRMGTNPFDLANNELRRELGIMP